VKFDQLQGLRGVAAITVVISHALAMFYLTGRLDAATPVVAPLAHFAGVLAAKAVWLFFVLSGFVLQIMIRKSKRPTIRGVLASRWIRLYVPSAIALGIGFLMASMAPPPSPQSFWIGVHPENLAALDIALQFTLLSGSFTVGPLWTITWELLYSLLILPLLIRNSLPPSWGLVIFFAVLSGFGRAIEIPALEFLPMFLVGAVLQSILFRADEKTDVSRSQLKASLLLFGAVLAVGLNYVLGLLIFGLNSWVYGVDVTLTLLAVAILIELSLMKSVLRKILASKPLFELGKISFSLYLIHAPLILLGYYLFDGSVVTTALAATLSIPAAYVFYLLIEQPSHKLARRSSAQT
jgi:peptidoglycan/LPS O-acetylase OafA/YrhL